MSGVRGLVRFLVVLGVSATLVLVAPPAQAALPQPGERCGPAMKSRQVAVPGVGTLECRKAYPDAAGAKRLMWVRIDSPLTRKSATADFRAFVKTWRPEYVDIFCAKHRREPYLALADAVRSGWSESGRRLWSWLAWPERSAQWAVGVVIPPVCGAKTPPRWMEYPGIG